MLSITILIPTGYRPVSAINFVFCTYMVKHVISRVFNIWQECATD